MMCIFIGASGEGWSELAGGNEGQYLRSPTTGG